MAEAKTLRVTQVKSQIGRPKDQDLTLRAMGLGRIGKSRELTDNAGVRGMINKVNHLVKVEEL